MSGQDILPGMQEFKDPPPEAAQNFLEIPEFAEQKNPGNQGPEIPGLISDDFSPPASPDPDFVSDQEILHPGQKGGCSICDHHCTSEVSSLA